jgi:hypothetical protein
MAIQKLNYFVQFSNGYNKMAAKNGVTLEWPAPVILKVWSCYLSLNENCLQSR